MARFLNLMHSAKQNHWQVHELAAAGKLAEHVTFFWSKRAHINEDGLEWY